MKETNNTFICRDVPATVDLFGLLRDRATLEAAKRYARIAKAQKYADIAVLMAILGMEPDSPAEPAL